MAKSVLIITHEETSLSFRDMMDFNANDRKRNVQNLANWMDGVANGARGNITVIANMGETAATATITSTGSAANDETMVVNGVTFTGKTSGASGDQFNISGTVATQATNIAAAINASSSAGVASVTATSALGVVTLTADVPGVVGNAMTLSEALANVVVSGANFTGGASDEDITWSA